MTDSNPILRAVSTSSNTCSTGCTRCTAFWTAAEAGQQRECFVRSRGVIAVADPDEWDDVGNPSRNGPFESTLVSSSFAVAGRARVRLRFALARSTVLNDGVKERLRQQCSSWLTSEGDLLVTCDATRSQLQNLEKARDRLADAVRNALVPPRPRRPTKPSKGAQVRRLKTKKERKDVKAGRGRVRDD